MTKSLLSTVVFSVVKFSAAVLTESDCGQDRLLGHH